MKRIVKLALVISLFMYAWSQVFGAQYGINMESLPNSSLAEKRRDELTQLDFTPTQIKIISPNNAVIVYGRFASLSEAHWYSKELNKRGYFTEVLQFQDELPEDQIPPINYPYENIINTKGLDTAPDINLTRETDTRIAEFFTVKESEGNQKARDKVYEIMNASDKNDPIQGWCLSRLAYLSYAENKKDEALRLFKQLADGSVSATKAQRIDALQRFAHSLIGKEYREKTEGPLRLDAAQAFRLLAQYKETPEGKCEALLQVAGLTLELARGYKQSTYEEARNACQKILEITPPELTRIRATAELMYAETYIYPTDNPDVNLDKAQSLLLDIISKYPERRREVGMATYWICNINKWRNDWGNTKIWALKVLEMNMKDKELYYNVNIPAKAMYDLTISEAYMKNPAEAIAWKQRLLTEYPSSEEAQKIKNFIIP